MNRQALLQCWGNGHFCKVFKRLSPLKPKFGNVCKSRYGIKAFHHQMVKLNKYHETLAPILLALIPCCQQLLSAIHYFQRCTSSSSHEQYFGLKWRENVLCNQSINTTFDPSQFSLKNIYKSSEQGVCSVSSSPFDLYKETYLCCIYAIYILKNSRIVYLNFLEYFTLNVSVLYVCYKNFSKNCALVYMYLDIFGKCIAPWAFRAQICFLVCMSIGRGEIEQSPIWSITQILFCKMVTQFFKCEIMRYFREFFTKFLF